jgi:hypothetical protein
MQRTVAASQIILNERYSEEPQFNFKRVVFEKLTLALLQCLLRFLALQLKNIINSKYIFLLSCRSSFRRLRACLSRDLHRRLVLPSRV